ncbi:TlpA family protein disulfide reductase [Halopiger djelfimassiliensis]|uniref:TlpA family protein disulfide reductase n=1 Tax=Halopiger djelfimassiliensis TaxID=1293047 RepID=UPI00067781FA|nr:redoxin domain-containing protein [Halopiger djelfimassiliensis]
MKRRELGAAVASIGVLGGAGGIVWKGLPTIGDEPTTPAADAGTDTDDRMVFETIDARGSDERTIPVPNDGVILAMFFEPSCGLCQALVPKLAEARKRLREEYGDRLTVVGITHRQPEDELREWWRTHGGNGYVGFDRGSNVKANYRVVGYPVLVAIDADGRERWKENRVLEPETIAMHVEPVLEEAAAEREDQRGTESDEANESAARDDA